MFPFYLLLGTHAMDFFIPKTHGYVLWTNFASNYRQYFNTSNFLWDIDIEIIALCLIYFAHDSFLVEFDHPHCGCGHITWL